MIELEVPEWDQRELNQLELLDGYKGPLWTVIYNKYRRRGLDVDAAVRATKAWMRNSAEQFGRRRSHGTGG